MTNNHKELEDAYSQLHPIERIVFPVLSEGSTLKGIISKAKIPEVQCSRALQWLSNKNLIKLDQSSKQTIELSELGENYAKDGLPERRLLDNLKDETETISFDSVTKKAGLDRQEAQAALGILKSKAAIEISKIDSGLAIKITPAGVTLKKKDFLEETFLKSEFPLSVSDLTQEQKYSLDSLKKRKKILIFGTEKSITVSFTPLGKKLASSWDKLKDSSFSERLTSKMLKEGEWKNTNFRKYDVEAPVPKIDIGRKQHYRKFLDDVREKFIALGFSEMTGPIVETEFWNMDALFMPQFHSARDIHDAYYVKSPKIDNKIPSEILKNVKSSHESGFNTGSKGWQYVFDTEKTKQHILRTQGTALSARTLASKDLNIPGKYFAIARCFRYDVIDATHLSDFNQVEGIVIEPGLNISHLFGLLELLAKQVAGAKETKIVPAYFPFTEPSAALYAKHPEMGWIELGGSGIFRPEMTAPLGVDCPVIAWGIGVDRLAMFKLGINNIRDLFSQDLEVLRNSKVV